MSEVMLPETESPAHEAVAAAPRQLRLSALWATRTRAAVVAALAGVLVYIGSLWNGFAYDDVAIIPGDPRITHFQFLKIFLGPYWPRHADLAIYRPLTSLSFAADWFISRGYQSVFHAVNVLEHGAVCALVFLLLAEFFTPAAALLGALLFAVHPVHVEAVANVVGRAEVVSAIFYLLAVLLWVRRGERAGLGRIALITACYAAALLHKESSATLPAALVLVDAAAGRWRLDWPSLRGYLARVWPMLTVLAAVLGGYIALRMYVLGRMSPDVLDPIFDVPLTRGERTLTALQAWPQYARLLFYPRVLLADYGPRTMMPTRVLDPAALLGIGIVAALVLGGLSALARGAGRTALGLLWFPLTVLPVSNLLFQIGIIVAERTLYLPALALSIGAAALAEWAAGRALAPRRWLLAGALAVLAACAVRTAVRVPAWESTDKLFYALKADSPQAFRAWWHLARIARREKKPDLEIARYDTAMMYWPNRKGMVMEAISRAIAVRHLVQARNMAAFAARRWPDDVSAQRYLAAASLDLGDTASARAAARAGLSISPGDSTLMRMSRSLRLQGVR